MADSSSILDQVITGIKKLPGQAVGAPVDLANLLGNIVRAGVGYIGGQAGLPASSLPELVSDPVGGSEWINSKFGLEKSKGLAEDVTSMLGGMLTPGGAAKTAIVVPAFITKEFQVENAAKSLLERGMSGPEVWKLTKIFQGLEADKPLKTVIPDSGARLRMYEPGNTSPDNGMVSINPRDNVTVRIPRSPVTTLGKVLDHPDLYAAFPGIEKTPVRGKPEPGGSYNPANDLITLGSYPTEQQFLSTTLHEVNHLIQNIFAFDQGGNPGMFLRSSDKRIAAARKEANAMGDGPAIQALDVMEAKAYQQYHLLGGEAESVYTQTAHAQGDYSTYPYHLYENAPGSILRNPPGKNVFPFIDEQEPFKSILATYAPLP